MSKKTAVAAPKVKSDRTTINRKRRNALERKCLPKALKVLYAGSDHVTFRGILAAWKEGRKKAPNAAT